MSIANSKSLGARIRIFKSRPPGWRDFFTLVMPGSVAVLLPAGYGLYRYRYASVQYGPIAAQHWVRPWVLLTLIAVLIFASAVLIRLRNARRTVAVHERGLHINLSKKINLRWEEIEGIAAETTEERMIGVLLRGSYRGWINPASGKPIFLPPSIQGIPELLTLIKAKLYPRLLPRLQTNLQEGQWLHFGPLAIQKEGIIFRKNKSRKPFQAIPWREVNNIDILSGYLVVELSDRPRQRLPISNIPNLELLLQIIQTGVNL